MLLHDLCSADPGPGVLSSTTLAPAVGLGMSVLGTQAQEAACRASQSVSVSSEQQTHPRVLGVNWGARCPSGASPPGLSSQLWRSRGSCGRESLARGGHQGAAGCQPEEQQEGASVRVEAGGEEVKQEVGRV